MSDIILTKETPIDFIESLFFQGKTGKRVKSLTYQGKPVKVDESFIDFDEVLEGIRRKRRLENAKRSYEKNKESRLERERTRYAKKKELDQKRPIGRPRMVFDKVES